MKTSLFALALATTLGAAHAHNAWLLPSTTVLSKGDVITVDAAVSNDLFVANHNALRIDGLQITAPDGSMIKADNEAKLKQGFRSLYGTSVYGYLRDQRMETAWRLLAQRELSVSEVALRVGYANPSKFAAAFRKRFGFAPSTLRY